MNKEEIRLAIAEAKSGLGAWDGKFFDTIGRMIVSANNMSDKAKVYFATLQAAGGIYSTFRGWTVYLPSTADVFAHIDEVGGLENIQPVLPLIEWAEDGFGPTHYIQLENNNWIKCAYNKEIGAFLDALFSYI